VHRDAVGGQPPPEFLVEAQVLAEAAVAEDDGPRTSPSGSQAWWWMRPREPMKNGIVPIPSGNR
jgi:hypothetical protein